MPVCSRCGQQNPEGFRFCGRCASPLDGGEAEREQRKTVTVLFCDVTGSTALGERLDPEALRRVMRRYFDEIEAVVARHGGTVEKFVGDAVMAVFGIPKVQEDDALRAVRAAAEVRDRLPAVAAALGVELAFRTGLNTGEVVVGAGQTLATGDAVNVAARLEQAAAPGEVLIGADTRRLVRDAVEVEPVEPLTLKGKSAPVEAYRLLGIDPTAQAVARRLDAPLVGRARELRLLREAFDRTVDERSCQLFTVLGTAGVGKSRLAAEFLDGVQSRATVLHGRCLHYGEGITFFALVEVLMQAGERASGVLERVNEGGSAAAGELFFEVRRLLEAMAAEHPLVVVFDDLHWAEPMLLDLLDHIATLSRAPLLLLCLARPELLESRPGWAGGTFNATSVLLEPLSPGECERLLEELGGGLDAESRARVVAASEGNPLFLEEMAELVRERGEVGIPATIHALLAARLEHLGDDERAVLERGAVEGKVFHTGAARDLTPGPLQPQVEAHLMTLVRKDLIRPDEAIFRGEEAFSFRHLLIRDAAYEALPKQIRGELHVRFADWLGRHATELVELDEIAGWHLEQAVRYREELGLAVDAELRARAAGHLIDAGRRATARPDLAAADNLLTRALALASVDDPRRPALLVALAETALPIGQLDRADGLLSEAELMPVVPVDAVLVRMDWLMHARPEEFLSTAAARMPELLERFRSDGDRLRLAKAHLVLLRTHQLQNRFGPATEEALRAAEHALAAGDQRLHSEAIALSSYGSMLGPDDAETAGRRLDAIESTGEGPYVAALIGMSRGFLAGIQGRVEEAREHFRQSQTMLEQLQMNVLRWATAQFAARIEIAAGNPREAIRQLREARDELERLGERSYRSTCGAILAGALYADGQIGEAEQVALASEAEGAAEDLVNFALARATLARIHADRGELEPAEELAQSAVDYAYRMDVPFFQSDTLAALGYVLQRAGRISEAVDALQRALTLSKAKGDRLAAAQTRSLLHGLGQTA